MKVIASLVLGGMALAGLPAVMMQQQSASVSSEATQVTANKEAATQEKPRVAYEKHKSTSFRTSDRCIACHVGMKTEGGDDYSIGFDWRASLMANSARDPYWQGSIRRETMEHPELKQKIENECSFCHMAGVRLADRDAGRDTNVFARFPFVDTSKKDPSHLQRVAQDGVTCSVCHQIEAKGLGTDATFNGNVVVSEAVREDERPEYGPFDPDHGHQTMMHSSTGGYLPVHSEHMRDSALCASCHTLYTEPVSASGVKLDRFPEQMPYQEWQHSDFATRQTCQQCHMSEVRGKTPVTALYGEMREGARHHVFVGANFVMTEMLSDHHDDLKVEAQHEELLDAVRQTKEFLQTQAAKVSIESIAVRGETIAIDVLARNLGGHKLPTAYPSRRAWLHMTVKDRDNHVIFESGALRRDGSIVGNSNDSDALRYEPHYREITQSEQVEIFESILLDEKGRVTTGLLNAVRYGKDNRLLPTGFDKRSASRDIAVVGDAADDPNFTDKGAKVRYVVPVSGGGPFEVEVELYYQPIGFRWAHNLSPYRAPEPERMVQYFQAAAPDSAVVLSRAVASQVSEVGFAAVDSGLKSAHRSIRAVEYRANRPRSMTGPQE